MSRRFFLESAVIDETAILTGQEAQHLSKVMRAQVGDEVVVFDGSGAEFPARIEKIDRSEVGLSIMERRDVDRELPFRLVVAAALPKGDRQRWLVEKLCELGTSELIPLVTARSVAQPSGNALGRLRRAVIEASKQCGRNRLMAIGEAQNVASLLADAPHSDNRWFAHPPLEGGPVSVLNATVGNIRVVVGPEGGFTDEEVALADTHRWTRVSLGPRVLRAETAAVALASVVALQHESLD